MSHPCATVQSTLCEIQLTKASSCFLGLVELPASSCLRPTQTGDAPQGAGRGRGRAGLSSFSQLARPGPDLGPSPSTQRSSSNSKYEHIYQWRSRRASQEEPRRCPGAHRPGPLVRIAHPSYSTPKLARVSTELWYPIHPGSSRLCQPSMSGACAAPCSVMAVLQLLMLAVIPDTPCTRGGARTSRPAKG